MNRPINREHIIETSETSETVEIINSDSGGTVAKDDEIVGGILRYVDFL